MLASTVQRPSPSFRLIFPDWSGARPLSWFLTTELLEARAESSFPTGADGPDEEVNVYLADLLERCLLRVPNADLRPGTEPLCFPPPPTEPRWRRADYYRQNGDLRLFGLGIYGRGDPLARRNPPWGRTDEETRARDLQVGQTCYSMAGRELRGLGRSRSGLAPVLEKLADCFAEYVHVLEVLARGRFGLGARLSAAAMRDLLPPEVSS